jgi:hypothetical protein
MAESCRVRSEVDTTVTDGRSLVVDLRVSRVAVCATGGGVGDGARSVLMAGWVVKVVKRDGSLEEDYRMRMRREDRARETMGV